MSRCLLPVLLAWFVAASVAPATAQGPDKASEAARIENDCGLKKGTVVVSGGDILLQPSPDADFDRVECAVDQLARGRLGKPGFVGNKVSTAAPTCGPLLPGWVNIPGTGARYVNTVVLHEKGDRRPTWNGALVSDREVREYLGVMTRLSPQPDFQLIVSPNADCSQVEAYRRMASEILNCKSNLCVEVDP